MTRNLIFGLALTSTLLMRLVLCGSCSITGRTCSVSTNSGKTYEGICVPLDSNLESQDCHNVFGIVIDGHECADSPEHANVPISLYRHLI